MALDQLSSDSTCLTADEQVQYRLASPKKIVAVGILAIGAVASTGAGISAQYVVHLESTAVPRGNLLVGDWPATGSGSLAAGISDTSQEIDPEVIPAANLAEAVRSLRTESGLTWDQLGKLFGVSRRAMHLWANGGKMNAAHAEALSTILEVVRRQPGSDSTSRREALLSPGAEGRSVYDELRDHFAPDDEE